MPNSQSQFVLRICKMPAIGSDLVLVAYKYDNNGTAILNPDPVNLHPRFYWVYANSYRGTNKLSEAIFESFKWLNGRPNGVDEEGFIDIDVAQLDDVKIQLRSSGFKLTSKFLSSLKTYLDKGSTVYDSDRVCSIYVEAIARALDQDQPYLPITSEVTTN